jgi:hypothetical protein
VEYLIFHIQPLKMDLIDGSETSEKHNLMPGCGILIPHPTFADVPDRWFRNVGKSQPDGWMWNTYSTSSL